MHKITVLGLGAMGSRMATRLLDAGLSLGVYNRSPKHCDALVKRGATAYTSPREAAAASDLVLSVVRDDAASRELWLDPERGALAGLRPGALALECSTLTPAWVRSLHTALAARGVSLLDAPVLGSRPQAEAGALVFLVGGASEDLERARPLLEPMAKAIHHLGGPGSGATMKLLANASFATQAAHMAELLGVAARAGIGAGPALELLASLPLTSTALGGLGAAMVSRSFAPLFPIDLVEKDLRYLQALAEEVGARAPISARAGEIFAQASAAGFGGDNISGVAQLWLES